MRKNLGVSSPFPNSDDETNARGWRERRKEEKERGEAKDDIRWVKAKARVSSISARERGILDIN